MYPKLGETHFRLAMEREFQYAAKFPFVDYGIDLNVMAELEKGVKLYKIKNSDIDANPPEAVKKRIEEKLATLRPKTQDFIPENFVGKGGKGYILKNWVCHRGKGSPHVTRNFKDAVRLTGTPLEY